MHHEEETSCFHGKYVFDFLSPGLKSSSSSIDTSADASTTVIGTVSSFLSAQHKLRRQLRSIQMHQRKKKRASFR